MTFLNDHNWNSLREAFLTGAPFNHVMIDNFFKENFADSIEKEFPDYNDAVWAFYNNAIENKKTLNHWDRFKSNTYKAFSYLNSPDFISIIEKITNVKNISPDVGLNGGGLHMHEKGGKLNVHLDYSLHPKLKLQRKLNIIIYLSKDWNNDWGGGLQLWSHNDETGKPKECVKKIDVKFNRAIIFDTTQNSWHGLPDALTCPEGEFRKSLAVYYLTTPSEKASDRGKALFAPHGSQANDQEVLDLIEKRASLGTFDSVYRK